MPRLVWRTKDRGSGLYSCYFVRIRVGLVHAERLSDIAGKKRAKDKT
jgi:hypothetical protein